jgi:hypothetical protein
MAQTGFTPIQLYYSSTTTNAPLAANLASGELAINITDGKLFYKDNANAVQVIGWKVVPATAGGTGQTSYAVGDLLYANTTTTLAKLADVATGNALISGGVNTAPSWGKIGLTTHVSGTLPTANGGTNLSSFTANQVFYASSSSVIAQSSNLTFDGTNLLVGTSTAGGQGGITIYPNGSGTSAQASWTKAVDGVNNAALAFFAGATVVGTITYNNTSTSYNNLSDYRLKNSIAPMTGALAKVALLKPCTYKWNVDNSDGQGFIAHELAEVIPDCVTGEKDALDERGNPKYQGVDVSFLVATLASAIQEQQAIIQSLKARLDAANL